MADNGATNGTEHKGGSNGQQRPGNGKKITAGERHTSVAVAITQQLQALQHYMEGMSPTDISKVMGVTRYRVNYWLRERRIDVLSTRREHFDEQFGLLLDNALISVQNVTQMLGDEDFLTKTPADDLAVIVDSNDKLFGKCLVLFAGLRGRHVEGTSSSGQLTEGSANGPNGEFGGSSGTAEAVPGATGHQGSGGSV